MISVIVPVYNVSIYLRQCVDSILAQTFTDFELLLINDGSKDDSGVICDEYAAKDSRVRVFHKENGGVSSARNHGLDNAKGEWIAFVDGDDWIKPDYLESIMSQPDADMVMCSFEAFGGIDVYDNSVRSHLYTRDEIKIFIEEYILTATLTTPWCKLFKRKLVSSLRFNINMSLNEDTVFVFEYLCKVNSIKVIENWGYMYRKGVDESLSRKLLPIQKYREIISEYYRGFMKVSKTFDYNCDLAMVMHNITHFRTLLYILRDSKMPIMQKYAFFRNLLDDAAVKVILKCKDKKLKGGRCRIFDFCATNKMYSMLFVYTMNYKGVIY